jgi:hypothetical protein
VTLAISILSGLVLTCFLAFNLLFPYYLWRCVEAVLASVVSLVQGRGFWHTLIVLWPKVRF